MVIWKGVFYHMAHKYVYLFTEGDGTMRELLGGKGANLAEMTRIGLPVPQGFTISTEACTRYYEDGQTIAPDIQTQIMTYVKELEDITGKRFGDTNNPLLVSVRSGARASMPGMMDTILNLGLNEDVVQVLAAKSGNPRWAYDCYRRFIQMYSDVVMGVGKKYFEQLIDQMKEPWLGKERHGRGRSGDCVPPAVYPSGQARRAHAGASGGADVYQSPPALWTASVRGLLCVGS